MKYDILGSVKENNQDFLLLIDMKLNKFFLKIGRNGQLSYPTIEELKNLTCKYNFYKCTSLNNYQIGEKIKLQAKVWCGKKLLPLSIATMLAFGVSGCNTSRNIVKEYNDNGIVLEMTNEDYGIYEITSIDLSKIQENNPLNITANDFAKYSYSQRCTPAEFSKFTGETNVTWERIYELIENTNIEPKVKEIIYQGTKNIEKSGLKVDLSVYSYNLQRMTFRYVDESELPFGAAGTFNRQTGEVLVTKNDMDDLKLEHIIKHEVLGHGMTTAYIPENGGIDCCINFEYLKITDGQFKGRGCYGNFLSEAVADMIAVIASGRKIQDENGGYASEAFSTNFIANLLGVDLSDLANYGIKGLEHDMITSKIDDPTITITRLDYLFYFVHANTEGRLAKGLNSEILRSFCEDWCKDRAKDGWTYEEMLVRINKALDYSKYNEGTVYDSTEYICSGNANGNGNLINVTALEKEIIEELEKYKKSKSK